MYKLSAIDEMQKTFNGDREQIDHTLKVLSYAEEIMQGEQIQGEERELIAITTILHDIGCLEAKRKYGSTAGPYQEKEGEIIARDILNRIGYDSSSTDRVCYIVGSHHTKSKIDGLDFQIQWEADLLVNLEGTEITKDKDKLKKCIEENFKTATGKKLAYEIFYN
jgi:HD superfamily phosphodiesterase